MPVSLEDRRLAVVAAFRAVAAESAPEPVVEIAVEPVVEAVVDAADARLDALSGRLDEVLSRLDSVETTLLEAAWERSTPNPPAAVKVEADDEEDAAAAVSVPALDLGEGRMSTGASKALFGH